MLLRNGRVASASGFTININGLGAKPVYNNLASGDEVTPKEATRDTTIFAATYTMLFVYSTTLVDGGCWICYRGYDANTNTLGYQIRTNSGNLQASDTGYKYRLWFTSADNKKWVPANTSTSTDATTSRTMNTRPINPFGPIVYNSTNGTVNSGSRPAVTTLWQQYTLTVGYSYVVSLTAWDPVYVQCTPQTDGSAVMNAIVKTLPTSKDGKIYIYLGMAYSTTAMELRLEHPVFYHDGNGIRAWIGKNASEVVVTPALTSGTKVGDIVVDGSTKTFYAPTPTSITTSAALTSGTKIGTVNATTFYAPTPPTSVSQLTNDSGYITGYTETDPVFNASPAKGITSADITNWNGKTSNIGTITAVKTSTGAHSTVNVTSGTASFNIPTKTSHLTNDSGFTTNTGTVTGVKVNGTTKNPSSGVVDIGTVLTTVDATLSTASTNAIQNQAVEKALTDGTKLIDVKGFRTDSSGYSHTKSWLQIHGTGDIATWTGVWVNQGGWLYSRPKDSFISDLGLAAVMHYRGTVADLTQLDAIASPKIGDVYHVTDEGSEWAWFDNEDEAGWEELGSNIDLSAYITGITKTTAKIGSASVGTTISADDITGWTTNTPTKVSFNNVITSGNTTSITIPGSANVVTNVTTANVVTGGTTASISPATSKAVVVGVQSSSPTRLVSKKTVVTGVTPANVVTGVASSVNIIPTTAKNVVVTATPNNVVINATMPTATYSSGILTFTTGSATTGASASFTTGASVTTATAIKAITGLSTGVAATVQTGDSVTEGSTFNAISALSTGASIGFDTAIKPYVSLTIGPSATVEKGSSLGTGTATTVVTKLNSGIAGSSTAGTAASLSYTPKSIPNISVAETTVVTNVTATQ